MAAGTKGLRPGRQGWLPPRTGSLLPPSLLRAGACSQRPLLGSGRVAGWGSQQQKETASPSVTGHGLLLAHSAGTFHQLGREGAPSEPRPG